MPCYSPLKAWWSTKLSESGRRQVTFSLRDAYVDQPIDLPCGQCIGCRLSRSRLWALRCVHEAQLHRDNCFVTLTYNVESLPPGATLYKRHLQLFLKRLRKRFSSQRIKFFAAGEYGENDVDNYDHRLVYGTSKLGRPHYHVLLFGVTFDDGVFYSSRNGVNIFYSPLLERLWSYGFATFGELTFESAAYVARYCCKKVTGDLADDHYTRVFDTGELVEILPEFMTCSNRSAIAADWISQFMSDVYPKDFVTVRGVKINPPRFYDDQLKKEELKLYEEIKAARIRAGVRAKLDNTPERLYAKEKVKIAQFEMLMRDKDFN